MPVYWIEDIYQEFDHLSPSLDKCHYTRITLGLIQRDKDVFVWLSKLLAKIMSSSIEL